MYESVGVSCKTAARSSHLIWGANQLPHLRLSGHSCPNLFHRIRIELSIRRHTETQQNKSRQLSKKCHLKHSNLKYWSRQTLIILISATRQPRRILRRPRY